MVDFKIKVLVLDDKEFMLEEIYGYITSNNVKSICGINYDFDIYMSVNPSQALDLFINIKPDILVVDFKLEDSEYDGIKFIKEISNIKKDIKIIGIASQADENVETFKKSGLDAFIEKPFQDTYINSRIDSFVKDIILSDSCNYISESQKLLIIEKSKETKPKEKLKITSKFKNIKKNKSIEKIEKILRSDEGSKESHSAKKDEFNDTETLNFNEKMNLGNSSIEFFEESIDINDMENKYVNTSILGDEIREYSLLDRLGINSDKKNNENNEILFTYDDEDAYTELRELDKVSVNIDADLCHTKNIDSEKSKVNFDIGNIFNKDYNDVTKDSENLLDTSLKNKKENKKDEYQSENTHINDHVDFYNVEVEDLPDRNRLLKELYTDDDIEGNNKGVNKNNSSPLIGRILKRRV